MYNIITTVGFYLTLHTKLSLELCRCSSDLFMSSRPRVSDWQPRSILLGMVEAGSVNVKKTRTAVGRGHEEVLSLQPMIPPKRLDISPPDWGMLRRSRCVQIFI